MKQFKIKTLRRIETAINEELVFLIERFQRKGKAATKNSAESDFDAKMGNFLDKQQALQGLKFQIRGLVATFNEEKGINEKTAEIAFQSTQLEALRAVNGYEQAYESSDYHTNKTYWRVGISDATEDWVRVEIKKIERLIQRLKDTCNGINSTATVEVSDEMVALFEQFGLID